MEEIIQQGQSASFTLQYVDENDAPIDLSTLESYEAHLYDKHGNIVLMFANTTREGFEESEETDAAQGECEIVLQEEHTATMREDIYVRMLTRQLAAGQGYEDDIYVDVTDPVKLCYVWPKEKMKNNG